MIQYRSCIVMQEKKRILTQMKRINADFFKMVGGKTMEKKEIWQYVSPGKTYKNTIYEIETGILFSVPEGHPDEKGLQEGIDFYNQYKEKTGKGINWMANFSDLGKIRSDMRIRIFNWAENYNPFNKIAIIQPDFFIRSFIQLYSSVLYKKKNIKFFKTEEEAIVWLRMD